MTTRQIFKVQPKGTLQGRIRVPGDKSISHRAIIMGAIAEGTSSIEGFLEGEDSLATLRAFRAMGVTISEPDNGSLRIQGVGLHGLQAPQHSLDMGNSGTAMRLLCGLLAAQNFPSVLTGDESLSKRPMRRVTDPLKAMGAEIELEAGGTAPIRISPAQLEPIDYAMPVASAQVKSCLLLASLYVDGSSSIIEPAPCRNHTELMLQGFAYPLQVNGNKIEISGGHKLEACDIDIPADTSSAAFFLVGASIAPGSDLVLEHVGINPTRIGVINILRAMGADIEYLKQYKAGGEEVADIRVRYAPLKGITIPVDQVPLAIDEFPALFIAAACAEGVTTLSGAEELRVKESDRIQAMADGLATLGVKHEVKPDGIVIRGEGLQRAMRGGEIDSKGDHRIAMAFAVAALAAEEPITVIDCNNVATSFPGFVELAYSSGIDIKVSES